MTDRSRIYAPDQFVRLVAKADYGRKRCSCIPFAMTAFSRLSRLVNL
ncbi:hypothetical protein FHT86_000828 [Rhizobium sp. BK313]|nr:hypothetical protein [Rhizobium sp. BK313]